MFLKRSIVKTLAFLYQYFVKPLLFRTDPEKVHQHITDMGEQLGKIIGVSTIIKVCLDSHDETLSQKIAGIAFDKPVGLSAGFDYEAKLTQILPAIGFGFATVGTVTYNKYKGNPRPILGRLPHSRSLMVNKGFKNAGVYTIMQKLRPLHFTIPIGISIGRTNDPYLTQSESVQDIVRSFIACEESSVTYSYYELNISCPNLYGNVSFYPPHNLKDLLRAIEELGLTRPVFVKMPIEKNNEELLKMLEIIEKYTVEGIIIGNLQKDRNDPALDPTEVKQFKVGNFSGKPTFLRSNELIKLTHQTFKDRFTIIGCGGVFSAEDAYLKIKLGASLVQLITGMIYQGPQLIADINLQLPQLLKKDGFSHISQAIGTLS